MAQLVQIPWQPQYVLTPDTLTMLQLASAHAGHNIRVNDAWRSYAEQKGYWDARVAYLNGTGPYAPPASNPDTGQRNHMRGAAVDIANRADRAAMLTVGFTPDPDEWWHFNNPRWASMPIIPSNPDSSVTAIAALSAAGLSNEDIKKAMDDDMLLVTSTGDHSPLLIGPLGSIFVTDQMQIDGLTAMFGAKQVNDLQQDAIHNAVNAYAANAKTYLNT